MGFQDILEIYRLLQGHIRDLYVNVPSKRTKPSTNSTPTNFLRCCRSCYLVTWSILKHLLGLAGWPALFKKEFSHIEQWFAVNFPGGQTATRDGSNLNCLRQNAGQFYAKSEKWKLVFSHKDLTFKVSPRRYRQRLAHVQLFRDGEKPGRFSACGSREALPCVRFFHVIFGAIFAQPHRNRQLGL